MQIKNLVSLTAICMLTACTINSYDAGDGHYSYLKAEMVEMHTNATNKIDYAITDENKILKFASPFTCTWTNKPDTLYRAMLYYNQNEQEVKHIYADRVWNIKPTAIKQTFPTDPVKLECSWLSPNKKYLNIRIGLKTGHTDKKKLTQKIGVVQRSTPHPNGKKTHVLYLLHAQNNVPTYYTIVLYISVPMQQYQIGDTIRLNVNTIKGNVEKLFVL